MTTEEILKAAQSNSTKDGEYEKNNIRKSISYGLMFGLWICIVMVLVEILVFKKVDFGKPAIVFLADSFSNLYEGRKNKARKSIIKGVIELVVGVCFIVFYIGAFFV